MYTTEWASSFNGFKKDKTLDLHKFARFFDEHIANRMFHYTTEDKELSSFIVDCRSDQLPHLMGLQHWNNLHVKQSSKQYECLIKGLWDMPFLCKADNGAFKTYKSRIESIPYIYSMLYECHCEIKRVHQVIDSPFKRRRIDLIFQRANSKLVNILELREKIVSGEDKVFVPTSFSVYNRNSKALIGKHTKLKIKKNTLTN